MMLEEHLALRAQLERRVEVTGADGTLRASSRGSERHLETVVGTVAAPRCAYQAAGSEDLHPLDAALNLPPELFAHGIPRMVAKEAARASFDEVVEMVHDDAGSVIARRTVEEFAVRAAQDFDAFYGRVLRARSGARAEPNDELLVLSTDGKGIVMRREDLRAALRLAADKNVYKLETRLAPGEKSNPKRMAQVALMYSVAPWVRTTADVMHSPRRRARPSTPRAATSPTGRARAYWAKPTPCATGSPSRRASSRARAATW
jgi:hypothetical protein